MNESKIVLSREAQLPDPKRRRRSYADEGNFEAVELGLQLNKQLSQFGMSIGVDEKGSKTELHCIKDIAKFISVPYSTFLKFCPEHQHKYHLKKNPGPGPETALGAMVEAELLEWVEHMMLAGFPIDWPELCAAARDLAQMKGNATFMASAGWRQKLQARYPQLQCKILEGLERNRVAGLNENYVCRYFDILDSVLDEIAEKNGIKDLSPFILNVDEVGFDAHNSQKAYKIVLQVHRFKRMKLYHQTTGNRTHFSAAVCIAADGTRYPTFYCSKAGSKVQLPPNTNAGHIASNAGYFDNDTFEEYIKFLLKRIPDDGKWRVLVMDGYGSHTYVPSTLQMLRDRNIITVCMPSHTSHALQPLDVTCFSPTKAGFKVLMATVASRFSLKTLQSYALPCVFEYALEVGCRPENIWAGFKKCGLWPFNPQWLEHNAALLAMVNSLDVKKVEEKLDVLNTSTAMHSDVVVKLEQVRTAVEEKGGENSSELKQIVDGVLLPYAKRLSKIYWTNARATKIKKKHERIF